MRKKVLLAACGALVIVGLATAGAAAPPTPSASLPPTSPLELLVATGDLPKDVTGQPGEWNFVGPASACPGPGWNCTTLGAGPVVQNGTVNVLVATEACPQVSQAGVVNKMECINEEKASSTKVQTCGTEAAPITQDGTHNELICKLIYDVTSPEPTQCTFQEGHFRQSGPALGATDPSETNKFKGQFRIVQQMTVASTTGAQTQDARQLIDGLQRATQLNESEIEEVETQKLTGLATTQDQNTGCPSGNVAPTLEELEDCNGPTPPTKPYTCVNLDQYATTGTGNISKLKQEVRQVADTTATTPAVETQGTPTGGNDAGIHQEITGGSKNVGIADQYTYQTLPQRLGLVQEQYEDPFCCGGSQLGGSERGEETSKAWIQQQANQNAVQVAEATGMTESSSGECSVTHNLDNNGGTVETSQTADPPCAITGTSTCTVIAEEEVSFCTSTNCPPGEFNEESGRCEEEEFTETETGPLSAPLRLSSAL